MTIVHFDSINVLKTDSSQIRWKFTKLGHDPFVYLHMLTTKQRQTASANT